MLGHIQTRRINALKTFHHKILQENFEGKKVIIGKKIFIFHFKAK